MKCIITYQVRKDPPSGSISSNMGSGRGVAVVVGTVVVVCVVVLVVVVCVVDSVVVVVVGSEVWRTKDKSVF